MESSDGTRAARLVIAESADGDAAVADPASGFDVDGAGNSVVDDGFNSVNVDILSVEWLWFVGGIDRLVGTVWRGMRIFELVPLQ